MAVTRLEITKREPLAGGAAFGEAGAYERIDGIAHFAVDPAHPANGRIVDLDKAARDGAGRVTFPADFSIVQPVDAGKASGRLLYDVLNRGNRLALRQYNRAGRQPVAAGVIDPGDGHLMRQGWTVAWCGWQWDVIRGPSFLGLEAPRAVGADGQPVQGQVMVQFQPVKHAPDRLLTDRVHQVYAAADVEQADAELVVREWTQGPRQVIPRGRWRFGREVDGTVVPDETRVWLEGGFDPGKVYEVIYRTRICPVVGTGLLATRDFVSFLRHGDAAAGNPCAERIRHTYGFGASQSGRYLHQFLYEGLNLDEAGRQVFDGLQIHIAGARRGQYNQRYGQPSDAHAENLGHLFPFAHEQQTDPVTGQTGGMFTRQRALGGMPKVIATNTSAEYWRGDASLLHTDTTGTREVEPAPDVRCYLYASTQHSSVGLPLTDSNPLDGAHGAHAFNVVEYAVLSRAALDNLVRWVEAGTEPPPSVHPRLTDGTAAPAEEVAARFAAIPGAVVPERLVHLRPLDFGPEAEQGIGRYPGEPGTGYRTYVSAVDANLNELAGIRLPDIALPVATYTGWNPRHPEVGANGQILTMMGSTLPFARTAAERRQTGDPRASVEERYEDRAAYVARARAVAEDLAARRYILAEDIDLTVAIAAARYDVVMTPVETGPAATAR